jgi:hypothetical protein
VQNSALDVIEPRRVTTVHGYVLTKDRGWLDVGVSAKAAWSSRNTLLLTQLRPSWKYNWYPAAAPPFAWETAVVLRAAGHPLASVEALFQLAIPALSRETRQWESLRQSSWGTAPLEAKLQASWMLLSTTAVQITTTVFAKPWERWNLFGQGAYRSASVQVALRQHI